MDTKVESITIEKLTITMTLDEWRQVLGDDARFKTDLRKVLAERVAENGGGHKPKSRKLKVARMGKAAAGPKWPAMATCHYCGKVVKQRGLGVHEHRCPRRPERVPAPAAA